jgi:hypothetical protein
LISSFSAASAQALRRRFGKDGFVLGMNIDTPSRSGLASPAATLGPLPILGGMEDEHRGLQRCNVRCLQCNGVCNGVSPENQYFRATRRWMRGKTE